MGIDWNDSFMSLLYLQSPIELINTTLHLRRVPLSIIVKRKRKEKRIEAEGRVNWLHSRDAVARHQKTLCYLLLYHLQITTASLVFLLTSCHSDDTDKTTEVCPWTENHVVMMMWHAHHDS